MPIPSYKGAGLEPLVYAAVSLKLTCVFLCLSHPSERTIPYASLRLCHHCATLAPFDGTFNKRSWEVQYGLGDKTVLIVCTASSFHSFDFLVSTDDVFFNL